MLGVFTSAILINVHNISSYGEIGKNYPKLSSNTHLICFSRYLIHAFILPPKKERKRMKTEEILVRNVKKSATPMANICCTYEPAHEIMVLIA